jgi:DNA uptake protein ComE-like DNA-binding protein
MLGQSLGGLPGIQTVMRFAVLLPLTLIAFTGCTAHDRSPDEIREQAARATSTAARDAKAAAQGVVEGLKEQRTININRASAGDLKSLPGIDDDTTRRIIDHRPYSDSEDLVKRHVISRAEYDRIAGKIETR